MFKPIFSSMRCIRTILGGCFSGQIGAGDCRRNDGKAAHLQIRSGRRFRPISPCQCRLLLGLNVGLQLPIHLQGGSMWWQSLRSHRCEALAGRLQAEQIFAVQL